MPAKTQKMIAPGGQRHTPSTKPRRLSAQTEAQIRAIAGPKSPSLQIMVIELDAVRLEREQARDTATELGMMLTELRAENAELRGRLGETDG